MWGWRPPEVTGSAPPIRARPVKPGDKHVEVGCEPVGAGVKPPEGSADRSPLPDEQRPARGRVGNEDTDH